MSKFFMMIGLPGSGKSTYAKEIAEKENAIILSSDTIRAELFGDENCQDNNELVFSTLNRRTISALNSDTNVIYDATNISYKSRKTILRLISKYNIEKVAIFVATPYEECLKRNANRERVVPEYVIKKMYISFDTPWYSEGFTDIKVVYPDNFMFKNDEDIVDSMSEINHDNPHHLETIGKHMWMASKYLYEHNVYKTLKLELIEATFLHDIGKPFTKSFRDSKGNQTDIAHYYNHQHVGAYDVFFTNIVGDKLTVSLLINFHMNYYRSWKDSKRVEKKDREFLGEDICKMLDKLHECDLAAHQTEE